MIIGYARTSTSDQQAGLSAQERDLAVAGAERIVSEQVSSVKVRPGLDECLRVLKPGDVLMVTKPDRLARSTAHLLSIVDDLNGRDVGLILLSMGGERLDTRNPTSKFMLTMLAAVAEFERTLMHERQREGISRAKKAGLYKGRRPNLDWDKVREMVAEVGPTETSRRLGIARSWVHKIVSKAKVPEVKEAV